MPPCCGQASAGNKIVWHLRSVPGDEPGKPREFGTQAEANAERARLKAGIVLRVVKRIEG